MKRFFFALAGVIATTAMVWAASTVTVTVKQTSIRSGKQFFAPTVGTSTFQRKLNVIAKDGDWYLVTANGIKGYVHASAVGEGVGSSGGSSTFFDDPKKTSSDEVALAGKGFNPQVEKEYHSKNPTLDFAAVDRMEKITVSDATLASFAKEGHLAPKGGN